MARRKKSVIEELAVGGEVPPAPAVVQEFTESTRIPDEPKPSHAERVPQKQRPAPRPAYYTKQGTLDTVTGAELHEHINPPALAEKMRRIAMAHEAEQRGEQHAIEYDHIKPYHSVINLKEPASDRAHKFLLGCGFAKEGDREYRRPIGYASRVQDRVDAERVFEKLCAIIRNERGRGREFGG